MKRAFLLGFLSLFLIKIACAGDTLKVYTATRISTAPHIDGNINDDVWRSVPSTDDFVQRLPIEHTKPTQRSEVRIAYTDYAVYVAAMLYDTAPDSILHQLGKRDDDDLNSDRFYFKIDPYHNNQDGYQFGVWASGIQEDSRFSDATFDAVWNSAVQITKDGWMVEMEIPYSAIRFPQTNVQEWGLQFTRDIRRTREFDQWAYVPSTAANAQLYWGKLKGILNVKTPVRLSLTPYVATSLERTPDYMDDGSYRYGNTYSYSAGADIKYGIDDRFTLDMTLLPDFGQVQSDKTVKNLSYREVTYDENRPFFKEGTELFQKSNLFYTRRIGKTPSGYYNVANNLQAGESVVENPSSSKLLNATKISGRTDGGLGIGFFNAITDNTYATIKKADGGTRKELTEPMTNYNVLVFDQQFKNNSSLYLINGSVIRGKGFQDSNITGSGFKLSNKKNTLLFSGEGVVSQQFAKDTTLAVNTYTDKIGFRYVFGVEKQGGNVMYGIFRTLMNNEYNPNDLGYYKVPGQIEYEGYIQANSYKPWRHIRESYNHINFSFFQDYTTGRTTNCQVNFNCFANLLSYNGYYVGGGINPVRTYDFYEPRTPGRYFHGERYFYAYAGISSDYRKRIAVDYSLNVSNFIDRYLGEGISHDLSFRVRATDQLFIKYAISYNLDPYNLGYATTEDNGNILFGLRRMDTYVHAINVSYIFKKDMSLTLNVRHYWSVGKYRRYFDLLENGELQERYDYTGNNDFNFNAFNVDLVYEWRFSPGSVLNIIYKNGILNENQENARDYKYNFDRMLIAPQTNTFAIKLIYYLDYQRLRNYTMKRS